MRADLQIDDDVFKAAERLAAAKNQTVDQVLSDLARKALKSQKRVRSSFPTFSVPNNAPVITMEMVKAAESDC
ncbi:MAG TPA: antitoxin [Thermoanaerobaculia bacterium]|nr:antitoxin [Thermoanaerobaculia bacterium]